jgi:hypothetical protein
MATKRRRRPEAVAYAAAVLGSVGAEPQAGTYVPAERLALKIVNRRQPSTPKELGREERAQLGVLLRHTGLAKALASDEYDVEVAEVVDGTGSVCYRLYGWNYGVGYLMAPRGMKIVAFGAQHDLEHWNLAQRDLFYAMDRAMRRKGHGFRQFLKFCWSIDKCWDEIADRKPGTVGSEPAMVKAFSKKKKEKVRRAARPRA